jgi:hypothetical protein
MPAPKPEKRKVAQIKNSILNPALTSHYQCWFTPPDEVKKWVKQRAESGLGKEYNPEFISLMCCDASLPGSQLATYDINDDYTGVTERHAYRRQYDERADFTFYVDHDYSIIHFFENWIAFIVNEKYSEGIEKPEYYYRMNYPEDYRSSEININKFERDYKGKYLQYSFLEAYPINIASMPVSYESSSVLKCNISFSYTRYILKNQGLPPNQLNPSNTSAYANPQFGNNFGTDSTIPTPTQFLPGPLSARGGFVVDM